MLNQVGQAIDLQFRRIVLMWGAALDLDDLSPSRTPKDETGNCESHPSECDDLKSGRITSLGTPEIPTTGEVEAGGSIVRGQP